MSQKIVLDHNSCDQLRDIDIKIVKTIVDSGVADIRGMELIELPANRIYVYLFLRRQKKLQQTDIANDQYVVEVIDQLIADPNTIAQRSGAQSVLNQLQGQIIEAILDLYPYLHKRYHIDCRVSHQSHKGEVQADERIIISLKNQYGVANAMNLCLSNLSKYKELKLSLQNVMRVLQQHVLTFYFESDPKQYGELSQKIIGLLKQLIMAFHSQNIQQRLSQLFSKLYHHYWKDINPNAPSIAQLENHLTLLQLIHTNLPYHSELLASQLLRGHIKCLLMFKGQNKANSHLLAINVFEKIAKLNNQYHQGTKTFINLFNILSSYGVHLIKDVWPSFYGLVEAKQPSVFSNSQLIELVLMKLQSHQNSNVIKHCLHELLKNSGHILFLNQPGIVYNTLIRMLNLGVHYLDAMFHMDSKMYPLIEDFFLKYYNRDTVSIQSLQQHLTWFLEAILGLDNYDHALIALLMVFIKHNRRTTFLSKSLLQRLVKLCQNAYLRYPIRKRCQMVDSMLKIIENHRNPIEVDLTSVMQFLVSIHRQYLILPNQQKLRSILNLFEEGQRLKWMKTEAEQIILDIKMNINYEKEEYDFTCLLARIKRLQLTLQISKITLQNYIQFFRQIILDYGESQYKSIKQRYFVISAYSQLFPWILPRLNYQNRFAQHLQAVLNLITMFTGMKVSEKEKHFYVQRQIKGQINEIVHALLVKVYTFNKEENFADREEERVIVARLLQWSLDSIQSEMALNILLTALRARISVLRQKSKRKQPMSWNQNLFQQTLYSVYQKLIYLEQSNWQHQNQLSFLSKDKQLRLKILVGTVLINDTHHSIFKSAPDCSQIADVIDRYDFERYEEVCWMLEAIYCAATHSKQINQFSAKRLTQEQGKSLVSCFQLLIQNMVHSLEYSLQKKQIIPLCVSAVNILFSFIKAAERVNTYLVQFLIKLIQTGQRYLIFQRTITISFIDALIQHFQLVCKINCEALIPLIVAILSIEQYRGFDSAVYCFEENKKYQFYEHFAVELENNYYGAVPRFLFIFAFKNIILNNYHNGTAMVFYQKIIKACLDVGLTIVGKEKMFLSGKNKLKLQIWQFLLAFEPQIVYSSLGYDSFQKMLVNCIENISNNSISQIRYYSQLFLMQILLRQKMFRSISKEVITTLQKGLTSSFGNINRSVAYIVTSGLLIDHILKMSEKDYDHFIPIKQSLIGLYNSLLTYVCSSVAYFRGLSQYFCLENVTSCLETKYVSILRENYLMDAEAKVLKSKLKSIIESYLFEIKHWNIETDILAKIPNQNFNVVCEHYYMEVFKNLGTEMTKFIKNEDGYTAYRNIWKKNVAKNQENLQQIEQPQRQGKEDEEEQESGVFQRKIDLTMDLIHGGESGSNLKIMITSCKSEALVGHLARTGEIFGIQQLIIPSLKTIQLDSFKSISVTAEKWLRISELGGLNSPNLRIAKISEAMIASKSQGYQIVKLSKSNHHSNHITTSFKMHKRCLLILDEEQILQAQHYKLIDYELQIGRYFSLHVEASIFIWEYFKRYCNK